LTDGAFRSVPGWDAEVMAHRANRCAAFLSIHGLLPLRERKKVHERIQKWIVGSRELMRRNAETTVRQSSGEQGS